jgi:hypothetical protein
MQEIHKMPVRNGSEALAMKTLVGVHRDAASVQQGMGVTISLEMKSKIPVQEGVKHRIKGQ